MRKRTFRTLAVALAAVMMVSLFGGMSAVAAEPTDVGLEEASTAEAVVLATSWAPLDGTWASIMSVSGPGGMDRWVTFDFRNTSLYHVNEIRWIGYDGKVIRERSFGCDVYTNPIYIGMDTQRMEGRITTTNFLNPAWSASLYMYW